MTAKGEDGNLPLKRSETIRAIERSGYPLEVQLLHAFRKGKMHPQMGSWMPTARGGTEHREIDLMVQVNAHSPQSERSIHAGVYYFVEAKNLGAPAGLVGIADSGEPCGIAQNVARFSGVFSKGPLMQSRSALAKCIEPLLQGPQCVHCTIVRKESSKVKAEMDGRYAESMRTVVKAAYWHHVDWNDYLRTMPPSGDLRLFLPLLIVDTRDLYTFEPSTGLLKAVEQFQLLQNWDVGGIIHWTCLTVLRADAVDKFIVSAMETRTLLERELRLRHQTIWQELEADRCAVGGTANDARGIDAIASGTENVR